MDESTRTQRSKALSAWLRHKPERAGLTLSKEGWATIPDVLAAFDRQETPVTQSELVRIVRLDPKGRFELEGDRIRARYGHSVELEAKPHPGMPPAKLFHGTPHRYLARILETGLRPMKRQYVHLSPDKKTAREVGARRDQAPVILVIAAHEAHEAGIQFYPRGKGIWQSDPIPPQFLSVLEESGRPQENEDSDADQPRRARAEAPGDPRRRRPKGGFLRPR